MQRMEFEQTVGKAQKISSSVKLLAGAAVFLGLALGVYLLVRASQKGPQPSLSDPQVKTAMIPIKGMTCASCVARVKKTLKSIDGVMEVDVSLEHREARVQYLHTKVSLERLAAAVNDLGYKAGTPTEEVTR